MAYVILAVVSFLLLLDGDVETYGQNFRRFDTPLACFSPPLLWRCPNVEAIMHHPFGQLWYGGLWYESREGWSKNGSNVQKELRNYTLIIEASVY